MDAMHGIGLFQWPDGRIFFGGFNQGKKNGQGTYLWPSGQCYVGEFKNDECHGNGILYYPDGKAFHGIWKEGKKHGGCHYTWPNGAKYFVSYTDGKKTAAGRLESNGISIEKIKNEYASLAKKTHKGISFLKENTFKVVEP